MSLLMQALKKAEQIKQKQSGMAPDETLTLSPKELATPPGRVEIAELIPEQNQLVSPVSTLELSPQIGGETAGAASAEPNVTTDVVTEVALPPIVSSDHPARAEIVPPQVAPPASVDDGAIEKKEPSEVSDEGSARVDRGDTDKKNIGRAEILISGVEQKRVAEQAGKILLSEQKKAKSVFSAKMPQRNRRRTIIGIFALLSLLVIAVITYLYWQNMNAGLNSTLLRTPPPLPTTAVVPAPDAGAAASQASVTNASQTSAMNAAPEAARSANGTAQRDAQQSNSAPAVATSSGLKFNANPVNSGETMAPANSAVPSAKVRNTPATPIEDSNAIQIRHNTSGNQVNPVLSSAYQSFISGDAAAAKLQYQKVLQQEPNNRDALLGMAAIALNQRQAEQAGSFYGRLLELDPADPDAIAGLTSLQQGDPAQSESRLKKSLSQNPQAGAVLFALGNLYAQQSRWSDAQQTYFRAYTTTPGSADYAFNLAVSLDKLNQVKLAREYYLRALSLGQNSSGNFSRNDVKKRIIELETIVQE